MRPALRSVAATLAAATLIITACNKSTSGSQSQIVKDAGSVAILVVDDFDSGPPSKTRPADMSVNCAYATNTYGGKGGSGGPLPPNTSHGELVFNEIRDLLDTSNVPPLAKDASGGWASVAGLSWVRNKVESWTYAKTKVVLVGVDTEEYTIQKVTDNIRVTVTELENQGIYRFVLNLSFIIAPCDVAAWLNTVPLGPNAGLALATAYWNDLNNPSNTEFAQLKNELGALVQPGAVPSAATANELWTKSAFAPLRSRLSISVLVRMFYGLFADDKGKLSEKRDANVEKALTQVNVDQYFVDLFDEWNGQSPKPRVVPVGAAGNGLDFDTGFKADQIAVARVQRLDFPFAPAMWNTVVSVSAAPLFKEDGSRAWYSNSGEVTLDGHLKVTVDGTAYELDGTSFSAPRLSHLEALYLLTGGPVQCVTPAHIPPLGYANIDAGLYTWFNKPLAQAVTENCQAFTGQAQL